MALRVPYARLSGFYFFYFALLGGFLPYWPLYLQDAGYDPVRIGWIMAILPATKIVSPGLWGWLADQSGRILSLIRWAAFLSLMSFGAVFSSTGFIGLVAVMVTFSFFWNATLPLFETVTLGHLRQAVSRYSQVRLWGSIGFIVTVWAVGAALDGPLAIACLPQLIVLLFVGQWLVTLAVPPARESRRDEGHGSLAAILKRGEVMAFFLVSLLLQIAHGPYYVFFSVYLEGHGFTNGETGALWSLGVLAEVVLFAFLHRIIDRIGLRGVFLASLCLSVIRWLLIAWGIDHLALILFAQLLHAASFGAVHASSIHLVHRYFRGPHHGKGQALYSSLSFGLGGALGSLFGGHFWAAWGPHGVYTAAAGLSLLAWVIAWPAVGKKSAI
jgi:PPP family 3-phenylpropionic acid transporter